MCSHIDKITGLIVGRSGETITRICEQSGARLDITKDKNDIDAEGQKAINVLDGTLEQVQLYRLSSACVSTFLSILVAAIKLVLVLIRGV